MDSLPPGWVVRGDRNFGIFSIAYAAQQRGLAVLVRLTDIRARKIAAGPFWEPGEQEVVWKASRWDSGRRRHLPSEAAIPGRLIAARVGRGKSKQWLYLFTTLSLPAQQIVELYGRRWSIETDLRSLKRTVRLHHISSKSEEMMEKEILRAVSAYNLVRTVMCMAARRSGIDPRQLSFTHVLNVLVAAWPKLIASTSKHQHKQEFLRVLDLAARGRSQAPQTSLLPTPALATWRTAPIPQGGAKLSGIGQCGRATSPLTTFVKEFTGTDR